MDMEFEFDDGLIFLVEDEATGSLTSPTQSQQHGVEPHQLPEHVFDFQSQQEEHHHHQHQVLPTSPVGDSVPLVGHESETHFLSPSSFFADPYAGDYLLDPGLEVSASVASDIGPDPTSEASAISAGHRTADTFYNAGSLPLSPTSSAAITSYVLEQQQQPSHLQQNVNAIEEFFLKNGAYRPAAPCNYCRRLRLQCLILQTTSANPNPITSCSSCVALFRDCSLAERGKRKPSAFETPLPVIGHLHGVNEEDEDNADIDDNQPRVSHHMDPDTFTASVATANYSHKKTSTRSVKRTRILRNWFATHLDHPYPSEEEKSSLTEQSGLSKTQVINWFANARRRHRLTAHSYLNRNHKVYAQGSPMPQQLLGGLSPMERWKHSPPEEEPVSASAIENALSSQVANANYTHHLDYNYSTDGGLSSTSDESGLYNPSMFQDASSNSASSAFSFYQSDDAGIFSHSAHSSIQGDIESPAVLSSKRSGTPASRNKIHMFQCTFCSQSFKKKYDWVRHERSIHLPGLDSWVCRVPLPDDQTNLVWRMNRSEPECIFCGQESPSDEHIQSHEFQACAERPVSERTFTRKDHLWQHLHKFHRCRKWEGWKPNLHLLQHRQDKYESKCGFCQITTQSWEARVQHLASHFRRGATMADWVSYSRPGSVVGQRIAGRASRGGSQSSDDAGPSRVTLSLP